MSQPVLIVSHQDFPDPSWEAAWPRLRGTKLAVHVANTTHYSFSDMPALLRAAGQSAAPFAPLLGEIAPDDVVRILTAYTTAWMDGAFAGKEGASFLQQLEEEAVFPQVLTLMGGNF